MLLDVLAKEKSLGCFSPQGPEVSVIVPVCGRVDSLENVYASYAKVLQSCGKSFEFIFVVDGSHEENAKLLRSRAGSTGDLYVIQLARNFGESTALMVGFKQAQGKFLVTVPAYLQTSPEGILDVLRLLDEGHDVVVGKRFPRIDPSFNRFNHWLFHALTNYLTELSFSDYSCRLKGMQRRVIKEITLYGDLHRFIQLLAFQRGFRVREVEVRQHPDDSHIKLYGPGTYLRRLLDIVSIFFLFKFTKKPLRFFGLVGAGFFGGGFSIALVLTIEKLLGLTNLSDRPMLILAVLLMVLGVQTASIGLLGEIIIFTHARKLKDYVVDKVLR